MKTVAYKLTRQVESFHWWFRARRDLIGRQIPKSMADMNVDKKQCQILDYGCGSGYNLDFLSQFGSVSGADMPDLNKDLFSSSQKHKIINLEEKLNSYHNSFHIITVLDVLEHIEDDMAALVSIKDLLAENGQAIITVPAYRWLWGDEDVISQHKRRYVKKTLYDVLFQSGLEPIFFSYFFLTVFIPIVMYRGLKKLFPFFKSDTGNFVTLSKFINESIYEVVKKEMKFVGSEYCSLPVGASILVRIKKRK